MPDICVEIVFRTKESTCLVPGRYFSVLDKRCAGFRTRTISAKTHHQAVDFNVYRRDGLSWSDCMHNHVVYEDGKFTVLVGDGKFVSK